MSQVAAALGVAAPVAAASPPEVGAAVFAREPMPQAEEARAVVTGQLPGVRR